jgi:hypothetical protein
MQGWFLIMVSTIQSFYSYIAFFFHAKEIVYILKLICYKQRGCYSSCLTYFKALLFKGALIILGLGFNFDFVCVWCFVEDRSC